jgi:hypothetical protein
VHAHGVQRRGNPVADQRMQHLPRAPRRPVNHVVQIRIGSFEVLRRTRGVG